ncbi:hypothetical protein ABGT15_13285 [Flavobacterium enshiense]|uniref:hypothetical protein n=1 Tax=Flavobacterium enshiense TaxID=1341165 RepID=UPI00345CB0FC
MENIADTIETLYIKAEKYSKTSLELLKLSAIDKTTDVISSLALLICLSMVVAIFTLFINIGIGLLLGKLLDNYALGFFIISGFYVILGIVLYRFRHKLIKDPISSLVIKKLLRDKPTTNSSSNN